MRKSPKKLWNEFDAVFKPYNARLRTAITPNIAPYSWQHVDQIFSAHDAMQRYLQRPQPLLQVYFSLISLSLSNIPATINHWQTPIMC